MVCADNGFIQAVEDSLNLSSRIYVEWNKIYAPNLILIGHVVSY